MKIFTMLLSLATSILLSFCSPISAQWTIGQAVNTTSGLVTGKASKYHPEVSEYLGIRFGESTEGKNRFMPPKRYYGKGSIAATKFVSVLSL
jgi:Carboxylesterase family